MNAPAVSPAQARMNAIRHRVESTSPDWRLVDDGGSV